jgi:hypothetical protein
VKEERKIVQTIKRRKANCIGHVLQRNSLLKHVIEGQIEEKTEVTGSRGRRPSSYWMTLRKRAGT